MQNQLHAVYMWDNTMEIVTIDTSVTTFDILQISAFHKHYRNTNQIVADVVGTECIGRRLRWYCGKKCRSTNGLTALPAFPRLSSFRKYESSTEKLVQQEYANGDHIMYYSESTRTLLVLCTLQVVVTYQHFWYAIFINTELIEVLTAHSVHFAFWHTTSTTCKIYEQSVLK